MCSIEKHYRPSDLAELTGLSADTIRDLFRDEPGVLVINRIEEIHKRRYASMCIPVSVAERVLNTYRVRERRGSKRAA